MQKLAASKKLKAKDTHHSTLLVVQNNNQSIFRLEDTTLLHNN